MGEEDEEISCNIYSLFTPETNSTPNIILNYFSKSSRNFEDQAELTRESGDRMVKSNLTFISDTGPIDRPTPTNGIKTSDPDDQLVSNFSVTEQCVQPIYLEKESS